MKIIYLTLKNIFKSIKLNTLPLVILLIFQSISLFTIIYVYNKIQEITITQNTYISDITKFEIQFENPLRYDYVENTIKQINDDNISNIYVYLNSEKSLMTCMIGETKEKVDFGRSPKNKNGIVMFNNFQNNDVQINEKITIDDNEYLITGIRIGCNFNEISIESLKENSLIYGINIFTKKVLLDHSVDKFSEEISNYFSNAEVIAPKVINKIYEKNNNYSIIILLIMILLVTLNVMYIYAFVIKKKENEINVYILCGANSYLIEFIYGLEMFIYLLIDIFITIAVWLLVKDYLILLDKINFFLPIFMCFCISFIVFILVFKRIRGNVK